MTRKRLIRDEPPLPDSAQLARSLFDDYPDGRDFDRAALIADATVNFDAFGYYGLSLWAVAEPWPLDWILANKARKARRVALYTAAAFRGQGLVLVPSGRAPHVDVTVDAADILSSGAFQVTATTAEELADRFLAAAYTVVVNASFAPDPG